MLGELSLDGAINAIRGVLPIAAAARRLGLTRIVLPPQNAGEACIVTGLQVCTVRSLPEAVAALNQPDDARLETWAAPRRSRTTTPTLRTCADSSHRGGPSRSRRPAATTC